MGIGGMSVKSPRYGGSSYIKSLVTDYEKQVAESTAKPPTWVDCNYTYHIEDLADGKKVSVWMPGWMPSGTDCVKPTTGSTVGPGCFAEITPGLIAQVPPGSLFLPVLTTSEAATPAAALENAIKIGCANVNNTVDKVAGQNANSAVGDITGLGFLSPELTAGGAGTYQKNYAMDSSTKILTSAPLRRVQPGDQFAYLDGSYSTDGSKKACDVSRAGGFTLSSVLTNSGEGAYLKMILAEEKPIEKINLYIPYRSVEIGDNRGCDKYFYDMSYIIYAYDAAGNQYSSPVFTGNSDYQNPKTWTFPNTPNIKEIIVRPYNLDTRTPDIINNLSLAEVEILGQAKVTAPGTTETVTPASSKVSMNPAALSLPNPLKLGSLFSPSDSMHYNFKLTHSESKPIPELKLKMTLKSIEGSLVTQQDLNKYFTNITIKKTVSNDCSDPYASSIVNSPPPPTTLEIPLGASAVSQYCIQISAKLPIYNTTGIDTLGAFELQTEITESAYDTTSEQFLKVGTHKASFIINKP